MTDRSKMMTQTKEYVGHGTDNPPHTKYVLLRSFSEREG